MTVVRQVAARQDSVVTLAQARAAGLTVHEVHRLCRAAGGARWPEVPTWWMLICTTGCAPGADQGGGRVIRPRCRCGAGDGRRAV